MARTRFGTARAARARVLAAAAAIALAGMAGCGDSGSQRAAVSGRVLLDGQPLKEGSITFIPEKPNEGPTAGGDIRDGEYDIGASSGPVVGVNRVEIRAAIRTGRTVADPRTPGKQIEEVLNVPARYHSASTLTSELKAGRNTFDFEVQSK